MPDIFDQLKELDKKKQSNSAPQQEQNLNQFEWEKEEERQQQKQPQEKYSIEGDLDADPEQNKANNMGKMAESEMGSVSVKNNTPLYEDPTTWDPEYTMRGFMEETGTSLLRGVGKHIFKGTGDMVQILGGALPFIDVADGNMVSRGLQEAGEEFASKFKSYIPEELQHDKLGWSALANPKFWSTHAAEMIPQLAEFIFLSKGGSALAKTGLKQVGKNMGKRAARKGINSSAKATTLGNEVAFTGKGIKGALFTDVGITKLGEGLSGAVGGGVFGNVLSGALNAADLVNTHKNDKNPDGTPFYTNEQLAEMASQTMINNAAWMGADILSWGMTYGGGWKALSNAKKAIKPFSKLEQSKIASNLFSKSISPTVKNLAKLAGKAGAEGLEETFQETFEEWAKMKAEAKVTGIGDDTLLNPMGFMDFYNSKENKGTKVISFALGALGGGAGNISTLINKKADDQFKLYDRNTNLSEISKKSGTEEELNWQKYHVRKQLAEIVISDKINVYEDFRKGLIENGNIQEEEALEYDEMIKSFQEVKAKAKNLNVKGLDALMYNNAKENYFNSEIEFYKELAESNIKIYESLDASPLDIDEKVSKEKELFQKRLKALSIGAAKAKENQINILLGKPASALDVKTRTDKYGNVMVEAGIGSDISEDYTKEDEYYKDGKLKEEPGNPKKIKSEKKDKVFKTSQLGVKAKGYYDKIIEAVTGVKKEDKNKKESNTTEDNSIELNDEYVSGLETENVSVQQDEDGNYVAVPNNNSDESLSEADEIQNKINEAYKKSNPVSTEEANKQAEFALNEYTLSSNESMSDEDYQLYKEKGEISQKTIDSIAKKIYEKEEISPREDEVKDLIENEIQKAIVELILPTQSKSEIISDENSENKTETEEEAEARNSKDDEVEDEIDDSELSDQEKEFIDSVVNSKKKRKTSKEVIESKNKKASKNWKPNVKDNDTSGLPGFESREKKQNKLIAETNKLLYDLKRRFRFRARLQKSSNIENVSQTELDNYLNSMQAYNDKGPEEIDRMASVNHNLKRMFPNVNSTEPVRVIEVENMYEALGSKGLGMAIMSTIFVDSKAWNDNEVFMEELSHVYYHFSRDEPEVQAILERAKANKAFVEEIRKKYDDYTLYELPNDEGPSGFITKGELINHNNNLTQKQKEEFIQNLFKEKILKTIPLNGQKYLLNELFANYIKKTLAENFDKNFNPKENIKREKDTKMFWGLIRQKGAIIENENDLISLLSKVDKDFNTDNSKKITLEDHIKNSFRAVSKGVELNSFGLESRADNKTKKQLKEIEDFAKNAEAELNNKTTSFREVNSIEVEDEIEAYENSLEEGVPFSKEMRDNLRSATKIMKRFGDNYNKALRKKHLIENKGKVVDRTTKALNLFEKDYFESVLFGLATEISNPNEFGAAVKNSAIREVEDFYNFLSKVHPDKKHQILKSMHLVLSNSKHVVGLRNNIDRNNNHSLESSFSQKEISLAQNIRENLEQHFYKKSEQWNNFEESVNNIKRNKGQKVDFENVIKMVTGYGFKYDKVLEQGVVVFKGNTIPIEKLINGFIQKGLLNQNRDKNQKAIYVSNALPLINAFIDTNRKFTNTATVFNAQGKGEPLRIVNNHLTKEIDQMIEYLKTGNKGEKPTLDQFLERYSHTSYKNKKALGKRYVPNQFLVGIYENMEKGILPTISQYHGLKNTDNDNASVYKDSTSVEQGIEDMLMFFNTAIRSNGKRNTNHLFSMGTFSDSPRKFLMNMKTIKYEDVFEVNNTGKPSFKENGEIINSLMGMHLNFYEDELFTNEFLRKKKSIESIKDPQERKAAMKAFRENKSIKDISKYKFKKNMVKAIRNQFDFANNNVNELSKISTMRKMFSNGKLNRNGRIAVTEFVINSMVNGYNVNDVFSPGVKGENIVKRFKANTSPTISVKNPNFKIEPIVVADTILNNSIAGSDSGMFITQRAAEQLQRLGKGVFEMNNGFKLLNASIEKSNPALKGKMAYLKGYTTVIDESHPFHKILKAREDKYAEWHAKKFNGEKPSMDIADGSFNHMAIIVPQSSDKSNFIEDSFIEKDSTGRLQYTDLGYKMTPSFLSNNIDEAMEYFDKMYYDEKGDFHGIESYNFGPQQLMDKVTDKVNTPVQMINSIMVNAAINGKLELATEIQQLIANQKTKQLNDELAVIKNNLISEYKELIDKGLNKDEMDQGQRLLFESGGSLAHPYLSEIITNQLAKTLRRSGNKLKTEGSYSQQKPDTGYKSKVNGLDTLRGYSKNKDGSMDAAEMIAPKNLIGKVKARVYFHYNSEEGKRALSDPDLSDNTKTKAEQYVKIMFNAAVDLAKKRFSSEVKNSDEYQNYIKSEGATAEGYRAIYNKLLKNKVVEIRNNQDVIKGYYVKGEEVIASRVPGDGPSSTGVFEVIEFDNSEGNQVMVSSEFNDIIGSDNDGDALFIQTKGSNKEYENWNKAFSKLKEYWLSPEMQEQITTKMEFEDETKEVVKEITSIFPSNNEYIMPFSPEQRRKDYNNTMVSKRNVGPVFNTHKTANLLAAYEVAMSRTISINGNKFNQFKDDKIGKESRNQQSAILANIILDNAKHGFADAIGLDENNINQAVLLVNLGVPLVDVGKILNSPSAKLWSELSRNNNSMYHNSKKKSVILDQVYSKLKIRKNEKAELSINANKANEESQQNAILQTLSYLEQMNSDVQKISGIMSGHNKIHTNPLVLEKQLLDFEEVVYQSTENETLILNDKFRTNPDLAHYEKVARETLEHLKVINPVYRNSTNLILQNLIEKIGGGNLSINQIESISKDIMKFNTSRLLGLNNSNDDYVKDLFNPKSSTSVFGQMKDYMAQSSLTVKDINNTLLFSRGLSMSLSGNATFIGASSQMVNQSFSKIEREEIQKEFAELPSKLRNDLIIYDMIKNGWSGPQSLAPFFSETTNSEINYRSDIDLKDKNKKLSEKVSKKLQDTIALKAASLENNPFPKVYVPANTSTTAQVMAAIEKDPSLKNRLSSGEPMYINVRKKDSYVNGKLKKGTSGLYEIDAFTNEELKEVEFYKGKKSEIQREIALRKIKLVPNENNKGYNDLAFDLALIKDSNGTPYKTYSTKSTDPSLDPLVAATIQFEEFIKNKKNKGQIFGQEAREDYDIEMFSKQAHLTPEQFNNAMEYKSYVKKQAKESAYKDYLKAKRYANLEAEKVNSETVKKNTEEELLSMYEKYGAENAYAYSIVMTPIIKELANRQIQSQHKLWEKTKREGKGYDGNDISLINAHLMTGSTIPSNHPASQAMAKMIESEYKNFINEKKRYIKELNSVTDALYLEKLGYGGKTSLRSLNGIKNTLSRIKDVVFSSKQEVYEKLYGNLVIREEYLDKKNKLVFNYKLRPQSEINSLFQSGEITKAEKDFYDHFKKTTNELVPKNLKSEFKEDYIPHTAMTNIEVLSSRGLLGLMANSRNEDEAIMDIKMNFKDSNGDTVLMPFSKITDEFKYDSARGGKNDINKIIEYRKLKSKAKKLLKKGINEDGSSFEYSPVGIETVLGFGAINRFANNRSIKSTELPSMDLNKALGDYIHSSLFVNGNDKFKGMSKLQAYIDGVLAFNRENNYDNMNIHVQKVWKDYFTRGKRQESFMGKKADRVILGLTRLNLFYALGYQANINTGGTYAIGNILSGKYHNIKDVGGKAWIKGEARYWGLDKGFEGGLQGVMDRHKRMNRIMKNLNFMEINVYDEVNMEKKNGLDALFTDLALSPMILSERWIQRVHMIGVMPDSMLDRFDENGDYKTPGDIIHPDELIELEDRVKSSHGRGYQPTDQRAVQLYSWGSMMLQFSRFLPTMFHDRFAKEDVNIYGKENIGTLRSVGKMVRNVANNPKEFINYRKSLSEEQRQKLDSGLKGMAMATALSLFNTTTENNTGEALFWDTNYYWNHPKLSNKAIPAAIKSTENLVNSWF